MATGNFFNIFAVILVLFILLAIVFDGGQGFGQRY